MAEIQWPFAIAHRVATRVRTYLELSVGGRVVPYLAFAIAASALAVPTPWGSTGSG